MPSVILSFFYHSIILLQAIRLNYTLQNNKLIPGSYIPAMCYLLLTALLPFWNNITPALIANFFILLLLSLVFKLASSEKKNQICFDIGFVTGLAVIFYVPLLTIVVVMLLGILIFSPVNIKNIFLYFLGLVLPFYFTFSICYLTDSIPLLIKHLPRFGWEIPHILSTKDFKIPLMAATVMVVLGLVKINYNNLVIIARNGWTFIVMMLLITGLSILFLLNYSYETLLIIMLPAAAISSNFFIYNKSKLISAVIFWIMFIASYYNIIQHYFL